MGVLLLTKYIVLGVLLNILQCTGPSSTTKNYRPKILVVPKLRSHDLDCSKTFLSIKLACTISTLFSDFLIVLTWFYMVFILLNSLPISFYTNQFWQHIYLKKIRVIRDFNGAHEIVVGEAEEYLTRSILTRRQRDIWQYVLLTTSKFIQVSIIILGHSRSASAQTWSFGMNIPI